MWSGIVFWGVPGSPGFPRHPPRRPCGVKMLSFDPTRNLSVFAVRHYVNGNNIINAVAGSWPDVKAAQTWITESMEPEVPKESLRDSGAMMRLDMMIATNLVEKFAEMKRNSKLSVQRIHFLSQINRMEHSCHIEGCLLTGREIRAI
eukprot:4322387-Pyramimonas_sp.AAC.1